MKSAVVSLSNIKPSEWVEKNRVMTADVSPIPGKFSYKNSPYTREIIDCLAPDHPSRKIAVMKGAQIGFSTGVIEGGIGWIISQNPGNILFLVGHDDLVKDAGNKVDRMIDHSGIRNFIKTSSMRARNTKSGDTDGMKEFPGGYLKMGISNHKTLRNISMQYGFIDDLESMKGSSKESGSTIEMIEQRFAAYAKKMKLFYISTPELAETSNIEPVYLKGDQRKYHIPCPCCGEKIRLEWSIESEVNLTEKAGMHWELDDDGLLIPDSVGFICYKCGDFFDDSNKAELIRMGEWIPTEKPVEPGYFSYHISSLYAPTFMYSWEKYVRQWIDCNPVGGVRNEEKYKTFRNLVLGETYNLPSEKIKANELQKNIREYKIGTVPEKLSIADGNGKIVLITLGCDINGKEDDARLDYEIVGWSESGSSYSIDHGSIGTFQPKMGNKIDRVKWTYRHGAENNIWRVLNEILATVYDVDTGRKMPIFFSGIDTGYQTNYAYEFIEKCNKNMVGLKGKDDDKRINVQVDLRTYRKARERNDLFLVETNYTKDRLANHMSLRWNPEWQDGQPSNFLNFPIPSDGKYLFTNYFSHFEAEEKVMDKEMNFVWRKISSTHQNHLFDCRLYAAVAKDIIMDIVLKESKIINGTWAEFAKLVIATSQK
jgi:phage terminase large subunit GpA-like protein